MRDEKEKRNNKTERIMYKATKQKDSKLFRFLMNSFQETMHVIEKQ